MNGLALYLISRAGAYVNGSVNIVDGGSLRDSSNLLNKAQLDSSQSATGCPERTAD